MPIPSTWREPAAHDEDRSFIRQLGAAALGLAAGLAVVVPAVLWLTGYLGPQRTPLMGVGVAESRPGGVLWVKTRPIEGGAIGRDEATAALPGSEPQGAISGSVNKNASVDATQQTELQLVKAQQRIESGDVAGAREILSSDSGASAVLLFALAETFDPNMLAAWGSRGVSADVQLARTLYGKALNLGFGRAMARLDALR